MKQQDFFIKEAILTPEEELELRREIAGLHTENVSLKEENALLKERLAWLEKAVYGRKSEKTEVVLPEAEQLSLFNEAEQEADVSPESVKTTEVKAYSRKKKRTHDEIFGNLEVEEVLHEAEDEVCDRCGSDMAKIGIEKVRDELVYVPARLFLRRHMAEVVKCTSCGTDESRDAQGSDVEPDHIRRAEFPLQ